MPFQPLLIKNPTKTLIDFRKKYQKQKNSSIASVKSISIISNGKRIRKNKNTAWRTCFFSSRTKRYLAILKSNLFGDIHGNNRPFAVFVFKNTYASVITQNISSGLSVSLHDLVEKCQNNSRMSKCNNSFCIERYIASYYFLQIKTSYYKWSYIAKLTVI